MAPARGYLPAVPRSTIHKSSGEDEPFHPEKLERSLRHSGATDEDIRKALTAVEREIRKSGGRVDSRRLFQIAHGVLRRARRPAAARYNLRRAVERLGPSGFPFERFFAEVLASEGWTTEVGVTLQGRYVTHEVDVDARRDGERILCECKFRRDQRSKLDVQVAMYVFGRAEDLKALPGGYRQFWLVTNGRFTSDALRFGEGMGLAMLGWDHPKGQGLRDRIDRSGLHPVTCLTDLRRGEQKRLLHAGIVMCRQLQEQAGWLDRLELPHSREQRVRRELAALCALDGDGSRSGGATSDGQR